MYRFLSSYDEGGLKWNDPDIGIEWPLPQGMTEEELTISDKDHKWSGIKEYIESK